MIAPAHLDEIQQSLSAWLFRLRLRDAARWSVRGLIGGLAVGLGFSLMARLRPLFTAPELVTFGAAFAAAGLALCFLAAWLWPRPRQRAARFFDSLFDLKERISTALELASGKLTATERLAEQQIADALAAAREVEAGESLPIQVSRVEWLLALVLLASIAASLILPNPQDAPLAQQRAVEQAIQNTAQQIEALRQEIQNNPNLTDDQRDQLTRPLAEAQQRLEQGDLSQAQAVAILTQAEQQLRQLADPQAPQRQVALQDAGEGLQNNATTRQLGEDLANGDLNAAARDLANLDTSNLSEAERQSLADELEQAADTLQATNPELASQFQQAAAALRSGNTQAAQQSLRQASQTLSQTASQLAQSQAATSAASSLGQSRQTITRASQIGQGQPGQQGQQGQQGAEGTGQGQGQGQGQGDGSSQSQGQGQGGDGAGRGQGAGQSQGGEAGGDPQNNNGAGDGGESTYEPIYAPTRLGGDGGPEVNLPGSGDPGDETVGQGDNNVRAPGDVTVPYNQVYGEYNQAAHDAIRQGNVPIGLRPVVRDYFSSLQP